MIPSRIQRLGRAVAELAEDLGLEAERWATSERSVTITAKAPAGDRTVAAMVIVEIDGEAVTTRAKLQAGVGWLTEPAALDRYHGAVSVLTGWMAAAHRQARRLAS